MLSSPLTIARVSWILRVGVAMEFLGHGMLGFNRPAPWAAYFAVAGIPHETANLLMPWVGTLDLALAAAVLIYPMRGVILYMAAWGLLTAIMRPLAGESFWEAVERAGNFGAPLALFLLAQGGGGKSWRHVQLPAGLPDAALRPLDWVLRLTTALLLFGHGALGVMAHKPLLAAQYTAIGLPGAGVEPWIGGFECLLALAVLGRLKTGLLFFIVGWKLATEALSPMAGSPIWVFVEHGGSYAAPFALAFLHRSQEAAVPNPGQPLPA